MRRAPHGPVSARSLPVARRRDSIGPISLGIFLVPRTEEEPLLLAR